MLGQGPLLTIQDHIPNHPRTLASALSNVHASRASSSIQRLTGSWANLADPGRLDSLLTHALRGTGMTWLWVLALLSGRGSHNLGY